VATLGALVGARRRASLSAYWLAWLASITFFAGFYALLVPLPRYLTRVGLPDWQIGFVLGAFGVAALVGRPLSGVAADRFGARATMLVGAASLAIGGFGVGVSDSFGVLVLVRTLQAIGYVAFTTAGTALVVSLVAPEERASRLATFGGAANVAIALAPAAVTAGLEVAPLEAGLLATAACACLAGVLAAALPPGAKRAGSATRELAMLVPRRAWLAMLVTTLLGAGFAAFFQFAPILADRRGVPPGLLYGIYGAAIIATRIVGGRMLDRFLVARVVVPAATLMTLAFALIAASQDLGLVVLGVGLVAVSGGLFHPALLAHHAALLPAAPGRASAAFYIAFDVGIGLGSWIFGIALQLAGVAGLYWAAAGFGAAALLLAPRLASRP
jgi:predicted MFS family arabinose efflux permease